jgi:phenylacetate-CoA ligase
LHDITLDTWCANIISQTLFTVEQHNPPYWIKSYPTHQLLFSQYHIRKDTIKFYIEEIKKNKITWLHAFPSVLNLMANLIKDSDLLLEAKELNLKIITTSSEKLFEYQRKNIESVFKCKVREFYGQVEGVANMFECEEGTLHIDESYSYVELLPLNNEEYKIIGTSYHNKAFSLVRYDTGDTCILYPGEYICKCGRKSRVVKEILGRDDDYLLLTNGTKIGRISSIFKSMLGVKEAQIMQDKVGYAEFRIVKDSAYTLKDENRLKDQIKERLGSDFNFKIIYLNEIKRTKSGKLKFVINKVDTNENR